MATYSELHNLLVKDSEVKNKVKVAIIVAAKAVFDEFDTTPNHQSRLYWAAEAIGNPEGELNRAFPVLVAAFKGSSISRIQSATDAAIQAAVDSHVNLLAVVRPTGV